MTASEVYICKDLLRDLAIKYKVNEIRETAHMLGWTVHRNTRDRSLNLNQTQLVQMVMDLLRMNQDNPPRTPYKLSIKIRSQKSGEPLLDNEVYPYVQKIGLLRYMVD